MNISTLTNGLRGLMFAAIVSGIASGGSLVSAADTSSISFSVKYADLNVTSPSGARVLYERIRAAAQAGCSYYLFATEEDEARCVHDAIANAVTKVNQPALTAVFDAKFKTPAGERQERRRARRRARRRLSALRLQRLLVEEGSDSATNTTFRHVYRSDPRA